VTVRAFGHRVFEVLDVSRGFKDPVWSDNRGRYFHKPVARKEEFSPCGFDLSLQTGPEWAEI
jgi:hypothetical protein